MDKVRDGNKKKEQMDNRKQRSCCPGIDAQRRRGRLRVYSIVTANNFMYCDEQNWPCLQKPLSYQGQSLILDSGSMCRNGHSLLLHSPGRSKHKINKRQTGTNHGPAWHSDSCLMIFSDKATTVTESVKKQNMKATNQTWSRSSIQASWSCRTHGGTRTGLPSYTALWASAYTPPSSPRWCDGMDTSHLHMEPFNFVITMTTT